MKFAKLYDQSCGKHQILLCIHRDEAGEWGLQCTTFIGQDTGIMQTFFVMGSGEAGFIAARDGFESVTQEIATAMVREGIAEMKAEMCKTTDTRH